MIDEISGDVHLSAADRLRYLLRNGCRNLADFARGPRSRMFRPDLSRARAIASGQSPGRLLTELLIEAEIPKLSPPRDLEVVKFGCGSAIAGAIPASISRIVFGAIIRLTFLLRSSVFLAMHTNFRRSARSI